MVEVGWAFHVQSLMRALVVVLVDEVLEFGLLLEQIGRGWLGGGLFEGQMHPFMATVLFRVAGLDALDLDAQAQPPHRRRLRLYRAFGLAKGTPLSERMRPGSPYSLNSLSKTVKAYCSWVLSRPSQQIRKRVAGVNYLGRRASTVLTGSGVVIDV